jgi:hypothetical protein
MQLMQAQVSKVTEIVASNKEFLSQRAKIQNPAVSVPSVTEALEYAFSGNQPTLHSPEKSENDTPLLTMNSRGTIDELNKAIVFKAKDLGLEAEADIINIRGEMMNEDSFEGGPFFDLARGPRDDLSFSRDLK